MKDNGAVGARAPAQERVGHHIITQGKAQEASRVLCTLLQHGLHSLQVHEPLTLQTLDTCNHSIHIWSNYGGVLTSGNSDCQTCQNVIHAAKQAEHVSTRQFAHAAGPVQGTQTHWTLCHQGHHTTLWCIQLELGTLQQFLTVCCMAVHKTRPIYMDCPPCLGDLTAELVSLGPT